ncbi:leucine-rich repeat-containing protein 15-like [Vespula pensylvanica]|uniref:Uncharacterized protein n=1 Tax=Vespula pensylvanica TaxID=30213 RepID=A0A834P7J1_VESPE|nr:leucine-rich repeat-containing protein 15-like [Vespula pensylvanica]KAF7431564.1 hypothetical protein H0235_004488 [Vespula pensylvanica]
MKKQTIHVIFCTLIHLILFAIGPLEINCEKVLDYGKSYNSMYNEDTSQEEAFALHRNTEDSDLEKCIMKGDYERFKVSFNFSYTIIKALGKEFISSPFIVCLNFEGNQIESVESGAFDNVPALEYLNMERNSISSFFSFNGHKNLKTLILARQSESSYYETQLEIIGEYPALLHLDLSVNKISSFVFPNSKWNSHYQISRNSAFPKLQHLDLSYNNLKEFTYDESFLFNPNITYLNLSNNYFVNVDLRLFKNLIELRLDNNNLEAINEYGSSRSLYISEMPKLKYFSISNNRLTSLSQFVFINIPKLVTLNLSNTELEDIPLNVFHNFKSLENLYLNNNKLFTIYSVIYISSLSILSVAHNQIQEIGPEILNTHALKKLYLNHNIIENIHENTFSKLELLEELYLNNNNLAKLPTGWDNNLRNLRYLNLSDNKFMFLESLSLSKSLPVIEIDLINNNLIHMKVELLRNLPENATIYLNSQLEDRELSNNS